MEGGPFSKWGFRLAADIRLKSLQQLHGWTAVALQNGVPALAPRTFVFKVCNGYTDGGRVVFKMGFSQCQAHGAPVRPMGRPSFKGARPGVKGNTCMDL